MFQFPLRLLWHGIVACTLSLALGGCVPQAIPTPTLATISSATEPMSIPTATTMPPPTNTPIITPTSIPKLTGEQEDQFPEKILETNGDCELPCWWGNAIVPGKTTFENAEWFFYSEGIPYLVPNGVVDVVFQVPHTPDMQSWDYNTRITITGQDEGLVQSIKVVGDTYSGEPTLRFAHAWGAHYAWDRVLARLGMPSQVLAWFSPATYAAPASYRITLVYENAGMDIDYVGPAQEIVDTNKIRACPRFDQVTSITLRLVPSAKGDSLLGPRSAEFALEKATGMSLRKFYDTFRIPDGTACLEQEVES